MKKALIIIFGIIFLALLGFMAYLGIQGKNNSGENGEGGGITFREFFPFGQKEEEPEPNVPIDNSNDGGGVVENPDEEEIVKPKIRKIYQGPVAGLISTQKTRPDETDPNIVTLVPAVRVVERVTGNVVDIFPDTEKFVVASSRVIPKIHEALFGPEGSTIVFRYLSEDLETTESFASSFVPGASIENALKGSFLPENLISLATDKQTGKLFYLQDFDGGATGSTSDPDGGNKKSIFSYPFSEWNTDFISPTKILFTSKPSGFTAGYAYTLSTQNNVFEKLIGGIRGMTILSNKAGDKFLVGEGTESEIKMSIFDPKTKISVSSPISTIPEKCVWSNNISVFYCGEPINPPTGVYPDIWYQGQISFNDSIEKYNVTDGTKETVGLPDEQIDAINLSISKDEKYLYFINKKDGSVWVVEL